MLIVKILFIGESWTIHMIHTKGFDSFESTKYEEGATYLLNRLRDSGVDVDYMPAHEVQVHFPNSREELAKYDSIVISDVGSNTFLLQNSTFYEMQIVPNALSLIRDYVQNGGGLLMIGGYLSFMGIEGKANYKNTVLADVLPVEMREKDDRIEKPEGVHPITKDHQHTITKGLGEWPRFLGYNQFAAKSDADVLVEIESNPFLVVGTYQKGKTACFASDCAPHWGSKEFMDWNQYQTLWVNILEYLGN
ncbi:glutamine amidotransferase [Salinibacillus xinjiangensis]|uniref:Cytoplasmic protein n=1 Tax=Salinibacillus xinjiangensis TaxID=1229268 RepID=A0A6G1XBH3_9BACI|nr:glutamine amidotransferase [Salinibacillus xinjiangensis]MRG88138.1 cytoplasmic protein [Salinibacillus xinjiangensis]